MIIGLLLIFGTYGISIILVHLFHFFHIKNKKRSVQYLVITRNNQLQIEWYIRFLLFFSWLRAKNMNITILDEGSTDDTLAIVKRLAQHLRTEIRTVELGYSQTLDDFLRKYGREKVIVFKLSNREEMVEIPLIQ